MVTSAGKGDAEHGGTSSHGSWARGCEDICQDIHNEAWRYVWHQQPQSWSHRMVWNLLQILWMSTSDAEVGGTNLSNFLPFPLHFCSIPTFSQASLSEANYPASKAFFWNLNRSLPDLTALAFFMLVKSTARGWHQVLLSAWAVRPPYLFSSCFWMTWASWASSQRKSFTFAHLSPHRALKASFLLSCCKVLGFFFYNSNHFSNCVFLFPSISWPNFIGTFFLATSKKIQIIYFYLSILIRTVNMVIKSQQFLSQFT